MKSDFILALKREIVFRCSFFQTDIIRTLYFGGGTPSVLSIDEFSIIVEALRDTFDLSSVVDFTVELNPDDVSLDYLVGLRNLGVNRISYGIQSFNDSFLKLVKRRHNASQAIDAVRIAKLAGIENISVDLIYGLPGLSLDDWKESVQKFIQLDVPHLSAYHLIYEEGTQITTQVRKGLLKELSEDESNEQFLLLRDMLAEEGYVHYEISNFAKPSFESKHNSSYWSGDRYLGLGPSAHSFDGENRFWNVANIKKYCDGLAQQSEDFFENEHLSEIDIYNECVMLGLRTKSGVLLENLKNRVNPKFVDYFMGLVKRKVELGEIEFENGRYFISERHFLISDKLMSDLFFVE